MVFHLNDSRHASYYDIVSLQMLRRIYDLQRAEYGPSDIRCAATRQKIWTIRGQQVEASKNASSERQHRPSRAQAQPEAPQGKVEPERKAPEPPGDDGDGERGENQIVTGSKLSKQPSESKVKNSMFKAIRSLGRSKRNSCT